MRGVAMKKLTNSFSALQSLEIDSIMHLDNETLEELLEMKKTFEKVLKVHSENCNYKITPPNLDSKDQRWRVWVKREGEARKKIVKKSKTELLEAMYKYYFSKEEKLNTLDDLFPIFLKNRRDIGLDENTLRKDQNHYDKFYKHHKIMKIPIKKLTAYDVTNFINECIVDYSLTRKATHNMKLIIKELCALTAFYSLTSEILYVPDTFRLDRCSISRAKLETRNERAISNKDNAKLIDFLKDEHRKRPTYSPTLALLLSMNTGLRNGELSSIEIKMVDLEKKVLFVRKAENRAKKNTGKKLKTTSSYRTIPLNKEAVEIVKLAIDLANRTENPSGYLFVNEKGQRQTARSIAAKLERSCKKLGITQYSPHDIRRTFATNIYLNTNNNINIVQALLGHSTKSQSYEYINDVLPNNAVAEAVESLLN